MDGCDKWVCIWRSMSIGEAEVNRDEQEKETACRALTDCCPQVWEALLTLIFFPVCVVFAWMADKRLLFYKYVYKRYRTDPRSGIIIGAEGDPPKSIELDGTFVGTEVPGELGALGTGPAEARELDASRREVIQILKDLKQKHPDKDLEQLMGIAKYYALLHQQKSRAFYRIQATRLMTGAGNVLRRHAADAARRPGANDGATDDEDDGASRIFFEPSLYHCLENCGSVLLSVACQGGEGNSTFYVDYRTEDGSAKAGSDYEYRCVLVQFTLRFTWIPAMSRTKN